MAIPIHVETLPDGSQVLHLGPAAVSRDDSGVYVLCVPFTFQSNALAAARVLLEGDGIAYSRAEAVPS